ncbi:MAG: hypothetical protein JWN85_894 [Gammaproteobacteria bacterium]|nr:hypothetical protein [Gammaproteobacteria bacterium]
MRPAWRELRKTRNKTPYSAQHLRPRFVRGYFLRRNNPAWPNLRVPEIFGCAFPQIAPNAG